MLFRMFQECNCLPDAVQLLILLTRMAIPVTDPHPLSFTKCVCHAMVISAISLSLCLFNPDGEGGEHLVVLHGTPSRVRRNMTYSPCQEKSGTWFGLKSWVGMWFIFRSWTGSWEGPNIQLAIILVSLNVYHTIIWMIWVSWACWEVVVKCKCRFEVLSIRVLKQAVIWRPSSSSIPITPSKSETQMSSSTFLDFYSQTD